MSGRLPLRKYGIHLLVATQRRRTRAMAGLAARQPKTPQCPSAKDSSPGSSGASLLRHEIEALRADLRGRDA